LTGAGGVISWKISCNHPVMVRNTLDFARIILSGLHEKSGLDHEHRGLFHTIYYATSLNTSNGKRPTLLSSPSPVNRGLPVESGDIGDK
jgi:hypothetical protein